MNIDLPWPHKDLSPNARPHFMAKARAVKAARQAAYWATRYVVPSCFKHNGERIPFVITACPPDKRERDDDNIVSACKSYRDGIAEALGMDDAYFMQSFKWGDVCKGGAIIVTIGGEA